MSENNTLPQKYIYARDNGMLKIAQEFAAAQYRLTVNELKAWILFIASVDQPVEEGVDCIYVFDALDFADKLGIDPRKARGKIVADLFIRLSKNSVDMRSRTKENGEQDIFHSNFISYVEYRSDTYRLEIGIPKKLKPYLSALKAGTFINLDVQDILALDSASSMRIFIYCKNLERLGTSTVEINKFRQDLGFDKVYSEYYEFKRNILKPAIREIRKHTDYKEFYIEDNGRRGVPATYLHFGFQKTFDSDNVVFKTDSATAELMRQKFSPQVQVVISIATDNGFNPRYIRDAFDNVPDEVVIANFRYVFDIIHREEKTAEKKDKSVYGRYFLKAVKENWAGKNHATDKMLKKQKDYENNQKLQQQMQDIQDRERMALKTEDYRQKAIKYLAEMDFTELDHFIQKNQAALDRLAGKRPFDVNHALTKKRNYREYRFLLQIVTGQMISGIIDVPRSQTLFG